MTRTDKGCDYGRSQAILRFLAAGFVLILLSLILAECGSAALGSARPTPTATARQRAADDRTLVRRQALIFMQRFQRRHFAAQWTQLSPMARAAWPSQWARAAMLAQKFAGAPVHAVGVGTPVSGAVWTSQENTRLTVRGAWRVPVTVSFAFPARLRPAGVAAAYAHLDLYLTFSRHRSPLVVGEGPASIDAPIITPEHPAQRQTSAPILMYHLVGPYPRRQDWTDDYGYAIEYGLTVSPSQFAGEMRYLASHNYTAISLTRLANTLLYGLPLPKHAVALTFDDGRQSPWYDAVPLLRRYGFTATFLVCSGFMGQINQTPAHLNVQRYLSWDQVTSLARMGFWIEDHGQKDINVLWTSPPDQLRTEVQQSAQLLTAHTHQLVQFVAYTGALWPYPQASQSGPQQWSLFAQLARLGYAGAVTDTRVPSTHESSGQLFQLPRVRISPHESISQFAASLGP